MDDKILANLGLYFPDIVQDGVSFEKTFDPNELKITLNNGSKFLYDDIDYTIRKLPTDRDNMSNHQIKREFGLRLKKIMYRRDITQEELSEKTGITQAMLSRYICGKALPGFSSVDKIAKALGCSVDEFRYI